MSNDNVVDMFGQTPDNIETLGVQPREYLFNFKGKNEPIPAFGYPAFNGQIYAVLDVMDDPATINFIALAGDVLYVADSERVTETV